ncbi:hypothetical protein [Absidia glauca]|uniref:Reverse transcriptase domain-containing protein n=1 Tax=Absidia glauca TaxID=4829 RepID=A0A168S2H1_ABSGL|nr:hypothetical protein [Absidia glauca]
MDAKVFTRLLTQRIQPICQRIVNPFQTGFVKGRFIGDNGALVKCILDDAKLVQSSAFGLTVCLTKKKHTIVSILSIFGQHSSVLGSLSLQWTALWVYFSIPIYPLISTASSRSPFTNTGGYAKVSYQAKPSL